MAYQLPPLPYDYNALEPFIDEQTMRIHHEKHHGSYVDKLNKALEGHDDLSELSITELMKALNTVPENIRTAVRNNGGGHANHSLFWDIMAPGAGGQPTGKLSEAINSAFGDLDSFVEKFTDAALGRFGSGWAWLVSTEANLSITDTPNQDSPLTDGKSPILGLDVWEHAYYLKYLNARADYIKAWWNVVNWPKAEEIFSSV